MSQSNSVINTFLINFTDIEFLGNIAHIYLYTSDVAQASKRAPGEVDIYVLKFLKDLRFNLNNPRTSKNIPIKNIKNYISTIENIISIKKSISSSLINYNNVLQHFTSADLSVIDFLKNIINDPIEHNSKFAANIQNVLETIKCYYEIREINPTLEKIDQLNQDSQSGSPILSTLKKYKEFVIEAYDSLNNITSLAHEDSLSDYFILSNDASADSIVNETLNYLKSGYSRYQTGFPIIDESIGGLESNCVTLIAGPSNHAKSLFMVNIARNIMTLNASRFSPNDAVLFITLEDQIFKFSRRLISVFGNYDTYFVKSTFDNVHSSFKKQKCTDITRPEDDRLARKVLREMFSSTINETTNGNVQFIFKHADENTMSCSHISKFIDMLAMNNIHVRALFIDYLDCLIPNNSQYSSHDDYTAQGVITQDMRSLSKQYSMPIVSVTQNSRISLDNKRDLSSDMIGDSYKKVRFADYILMVRLREDLDLLSEDLKRDLGFDEDSNCGFASGMPANTYSESIQPFEVKIVKAKDGKKDVRKFHLYNWINLRLYSSYADYTKDISIIKDTLNSISDIDLISSDVNSLETETNIII
jgi:replicative DNA helicase